MHKSLINVIIHFMGILGLYPAVLHRKLKQQNLMVQLKKNNIDMDDILPWHTWCQSADITAYIRSDDRLSVFQTTIDGLARLINRTVLHQHPIDVREIGGFSSSRARLDQHTDIKSVAFDNASVETIEINKTNLANLLTNISREIFPSGSTNHVKQFAWDGRLMVVNSDGSHRISAACIIAEELNESALIYADLHLIHINVDALQSLCEHFQMFLLPTESEVFLSVSRALDRDLVNYYRSRIFNRNQSIHLDVYFLPLDIKKSKQAAKIFKSTGAFSLNNYLHAVARSQNRVSKKYNNRSSILNTLVNQN